MITKITARGPIAHRHSITYKASLTISANLLHMRSIKRVANLNSHVFASSSCLLRETTDPHAGSSKLESLSSKLTMARLKQRPRIPMVPTVERNATAFDSDDGRNSDEDVLLTNKRIAHKKPFDLGRGENVSIQTLQHTPA